MHTNKVGFKVKNSSNVHSGAISLFNLIAEGNDVEVSSVGAGAVNQAVKIIAKARGMWAQRGGDLYVIPGLHNEETDTTDTGELTVVTFKFKVM